MTCAPPTSLPSRTTSPWPSTSSCSCTGASPGRPRRRRPRDERARAGPRAARPARGGPSRDPRRARRRRCWTASASCSGSSTPRRPPSSSSWATRTLPSRRPPSRRSSRGLAGRIPGRAGAAPPHEPALRGARPAAAAHAGGDADAAPRPDTCSSSTRWARPTPSGATSGRSRATPWPASSCRDARWWRRRRGGSWSAHRRAGGAVPARRARRRADAERHAASPPSPISWAGSGWSWSRDGALQYVPFAALPVPARPGAARGVRPSSSSTRSCPCPPLRRWRRCGASWPGGGRPPSAVAVLADPGLRRRRRTGHGAAARRSAARAGPRRRAASPASWCRALRTAERPCAGAGLPRLPFARREAEAIAAAARPGEAMKALDFQASRETASSGELAQYRIVHFATHGLLNAARPELSGLVLSLVDEQRRAAGRLPAPARHLQPPTAGRAGRALGLPDGTGQGDQGRRADRPDPRVHVRRSGARGGQPVAGGRRGDGRADAPVLPADARDGERPAAALRAAQVEMWREGVWRSPYYWAGFVLQGEWR